MIEFALLLPVLAIILFGIVEFSLILYDQSVITNASREGARAAIVFMEPRLHEVNLHPLIADPDKNSITNVVNAYCQGHLKTFGSATPSTDADPDECPADASSGDSITVRVEYQYDFLVIPNFLEGLVGPINLVGETVMRCE